MMEMFREPNSSIVDSRFTGSSVSLLFFFLEQDKIKS